MRSFIFIKENLRKSIFFFNFFFYRVSTNKSKITSPTTNVITNLKPFHETLKPNNTPLINNLNNSNQNRSYSTNHSFENILVESKKNRTEKSSLLSTHNTTDKENTTNINSIIVYPEKLPLSVPIVSLVEALNFTKIVNYLILHPNSRSSALLLQAIRQVCYYYKNFNFCAVNL